MSVSPRVPSSSVHLSVVVPVYGCADCLTQLHDGLVSSLADVTDSYELIFVDDRSLDNAWSTLLELCKRDSRVRAFRLSRNFGQHAAISAGLAMARGQWAVVMDCDLQDPPELIPILHAKADEGFDIVLARRLARRSWWRHFVSRTYSRLMKLFFGVEMSGEFANLSLISRKVVDAYLSLGDLDRHYILILQWLGFDHATVEFEQPERYAGRSSYTLGALIRLGLDGMFFQTTTLLSWIVYLGFGVAASGIVLAAVFVVIYYTHQPFALTGWTSLSVLFLVLGGFIIISTGVTGLYIGKIFQQVKGRPLYVIDEAVSEIAAESTVARTGRSR
jgi:glycosyltransferase involved in cell wall biosynthesis